MVPDGKGTTAGVALLAEGVDRNQKKCCRPPCLRCVALLAEGVDRNLWCRMARAPPLASPSSRRAWIEIKRNAVAPLVYDASPSSRRAWIEMCKSSMPRPRRLVALLAEGVDRNYTVEAEQTGATGSPSSRRAWIEMFCGPSYALRSFCRPPRGGRG